MIWNFLFYSVPWYVWTLLGAVITAGLFLLAVRVLGWERVKGWIIPVAVVLGAGALLQRAQQRGWQDKIKADRRAADQLIEKAKKARARTTTEQRERPERLRDDDGFNRD